MHRFLLLCLTLTFFCTAAAATSREIRKRASTIEKQFELMQDAHKLLRITARTPRDSRGRNKIEDLEQWAYTAELDGRVTALLKSARAADDVQANADLDEASRMVNGASRRAMEIAGYWQRSSTILWRERWKSFATLNALPAEPSDPSLLEAERSMHALLNAGDFARATAAGAIVEEKLQTAIRKATTGLATVAGRRRPQIRSAHHALPNPRRRPKEGGHDAGAIPTPTIRPARSSAMSKVRSWCARMSTRLDAPANLRS